MSRSKDYWLQSFGAEFDIPDEILQLVRQGVLVDASDANDDAPSFGKYVDVGSGAQGLWGSKGARIFVDRPQHSPRYCVLHEPEAIGEDFDVYTGDSLPNALKALWSVFRDYGLPVPEKAIG